MAKILVAEDDDPVRYMLQEFLERDGFEVVAVATVSEGLNRIATEQFDVLLSDLHMPRAGDGFTLVTAMHHTHPDAVKMVLSGDPAVDEALSAIRSQADEILAKPIRIAALREAIRERLRNPTPSRHPAAKSVASILEDNLDATIRSWLQLVERDEELNSIALSFEDRTGHLPNLLADLIRRLRLPPVVKPELSSAARAHGILRRKQGYTAAMVVQESRIFQVSIFNTVQNNFFQVNFSQVLRDVMTIADEVESQLQHAMLSFIAADSALALLIDRGSIGTT